MPSGEFQRLNVIVIGRVQGVGFRMFVEEQAEQLGLTGWVRNDETDRRRVEVLAEGQRPALEKLLQSLEAGPPGARVEALQTGWEAGQANFADFRVRA